MSCPPSCVTCLYKCFQISDCDYSVIPRMLASTIRSLEQFKTVNGINLVDWVSFWSNLLQQEDSIRKPFLCGLIKHIQNRFDDSLMSLTQVNYQTCPKNPPQKNQLLLPSIETEKLSTLPSSSTVFFAV